MSLRALAPHRRIYRILVAFLILPTLGLVFTSAADAAPFAGTPAVSVSPASLTFPAKGSGPLGLGVTTAAQTVTVKNTGTAPLQMGSGDTCQFAPDPCLEGSYTSDYSVTSNTCASNSIPAGSSCTFSVDFTPSTTNQETITAYIFDNAANSPQTVTLTGQGTAPTASVSTKSLSFPAKGSGPLGVGLTSAAQSVTVKNTGTVPMLMAWGDTCQFAPDPCLEGSYTSDYSVTSNTCASNTIPVGTTCTFSVDFTPSTTNQETITAYIFDSAAGSPQAVTLTGKGTAPTAQITPGKLSFASKAVGATAAAQSVTVKNTGTVPMVMGWGDTCQFAPDPCLEGSYASDYSVTSNTCASNTIPVGTSCTFSVDFTPSTTNQESITAAIFDTAANSPQSVAITGLATTATVSVSAKTLSFPAAGSGPLGLGVASAAQKVTVTNTGKVPVEMGYGSPTGANPSISTTYGTDYMITGNTCAGNTIPAGTTCTFSVEYQASTLNDEIGTLTIYDNAVGGPQTISLNGQATAAKAGLSASKLTFSSSAVGTTSAPQKVTVTNTGTVPLLMGFGSPTGSNPSVTGSYAKDFTVTGNDCANFTISVGTTCTFSVEFTPSTTNQETGTLLIYGNTADSPQQIALQGTVSG